MKMHKYIIMLLLFWAVGASAPAWAQASTNEPSSASSVDTRAASSSIEMADAMRQDGKIYIVVAVLVSVLLGVLFYLISLDKKVSQLEKELRQ